MAYTLNEFLALDLPTSTSLGSCALCQKEITDVHPDDLFHHCIDGKPVHADCYFDELGKLVEQHPIGRPGR